MGNHDLSNYLRRLMLAVLKLPSTSVMTSALREGSDAAAARKM